MPFTLAHPAAVLPLARRFPRLPLTALVIGSMSPDFPYFLLVHNDLYHTGHRVLGLLTFDLPASLLVYTLYQGLLRLPLLSLFPEKDRRRLLPNALTATLPRRIVAWLYVAFACLLGAVTHQLWDSVTHGGYKPAQWFPILRDVLLPRTPVGVIHVYSLLQYASSLIGLLLVWCAYLRYRSETPDTSPEPLRALPIPSSSQRAYGFLIAGGIAVVAGGVYAWLDLLLWNGFKSVKQTVADGIEAALLFVVLQWIVYSLWWHLQRRRTAL